MMIYTKELCGLHRTSNIITILIAGRLW